ncbi:glycosyltransferase family 2 protein [Cohnella faecalis]|uniref:Glycosyltransferase family 2 protein n=1 Tax=Cohnella faecalis TaxID=2315694 RepID=A0A398CMQ8_9BACL|nr:glycosyltransferase family 2 protein [Cohnella faecalis]RIE02078.1 glycosyltransferase family 2 protein [Cohnella faecalis]
MTKPNSDRVAVLLSTYNGERYLEDLLDSLFRQSHLNFDLFVRDDGSDDKTLRIIEEYRQRYANIRIVSSECNLGPKKSFGTLLEVALKYSTYAYFMFADQDDVWMDDKIAKSLRLMRENESEDDSLPVLVHSDLIVVDSELNRIGPSFWGYQKLDPDKDGINRLLVQNVITGCTMLINRKLAELSVPVPDECIMHDWWIGLIACSNGRIRYLREPTIFYRQHGRNSLGAVKFDLPYMLSRFKRMKGIEWNVVQASALISRIGGEVEAVREFADLRNRSYASRLYTVWRRKYYKNGFIRNIGLFLQLAKLKKTT